MFKRGRLPLRFGLAVYLGIKVSLAIAGGQTLQGEEPSNPTVTALATDHRPMTFKIVVMANGWDADGNLLAFTAYQAPNGTKLSQTHASFDSSVLAEAYFKEQVAKVYKVLRSGDKRDKKGNIIGKRAEVLARAHGSTTPALLVTIGANFYEIQSTSLPTILEFERQMTP